jgi:hypothetical protein
MKKNFYFLTIFTLLLITFVSCEKEEQEKNIDSLMPINTGNSWTYKETYHDYGYIIDTTTTEIGEKISINGISYFSTIPESPNNSRFLCGNDEFGNIVYYGAISNLDTLISTSVAYKRDAALGDKWNYEMVYEDDNSGIFEEEETNVKCISTDTLITTPKGSFHCKVYESVINSGKDTFKEYISINIGIVKTEHYEGDYLFSFGELIDYHLNKK